MRVYVMDNPDGYITQVLESNEFQVSPTLSIMQPGVLPLLRLVLKSKVIRYWSMDASLMTGPQWF